MCVGYLFQIGRWTSGWIQVGSKGSERHPTKWQKRRNICRKTRRPLTGSQSRQEMTRCCRASWVQAMCFEHVCTNLSTFRKQRTKSEQQQLAFEEEIILHNICNYLRDEPQMPCFITMKQHLLFPQERTQTVTRMFRNPADHHHHQG